MNTNVPKAAFGVKLGFFSGQQLELNPETVLGVELRPGDDVVGEVPRGRLLVQLSVVVQLLLLQAHHVADQRSWTQRSLSCRAFSGVGGSIPLN